MQPLPCTLCSAVSAESLDWGAPGFVLSLIVSTRRAPPRRFSCARCSSSPCSCRRESRKSGPGSTGSSCDGKDEGGRVLIVSWAEKKQKTRRRGKLTDSLPLEAGGLLAVAAWPLLFIFVHGEAMVRAEQPQTGAGGRSPMGRNSCEL